MLEVFCTALDGTSTPFHWIPATQKLGKKSPQILISLVLWARQNSKTCRFDYVHIVSTASIPGIATFHIMMQSVQLTVCTMHWSTLTCASFPPGETHYWHTKSWRLFTKQSSMASEPFIWFNTSLDQKICTSLNPTNCRKKSHWPSYDHLCVRIQH